jgi:hypothetical protein
MAKPVLLHEVIGDTVLPNEVAGAPLSGTEPMIRVGALTPFSDTQVDLDGLRSAARFNPPAEHSSWLNPVPSLDATVEMQGQMGSFLLSEGTFINVDNPDVMVPVIEPGQVEIRPPLLKPIEGKQKQKPGNQIWQPVLQSRSQVIKSGGQFND